jgi:hypothetical protein
MTNHPNRKRGPYTAEMFGPIWAQGPVATFDRIRDARQWAESYGDIGARSCEIRDARGAVVGSHRYSPDGWFRAEV